MTVHNPILEGKIWKQLLVFFFPILIGSFFQQLYNMVDTFVVGRYVGTDALAAVGTTGSVISLLVGFFVGIASGATVIISQYYGAGSEEQVGRAVHTGIAFSLMAGVLLMIVGISTAKPVLRLMNVPDDIINDSATYMQVYYAGIIGNLIYNIGTGILRAVGDSKRPLYILIVCCMVNIVLDLSFVLVLHWGVFGVAFATILSQLISAILILVCLMRTHDIYRLSVRKIRLYVVEFKEMLRIGLPSGMESVLYSISNVLMQTAINGFSTAAIAAWSTIGKIDAVMWMVMQAFGISISTFVGQNFGARQYDRVKQGVKIGLGMNLVSIFVISLIIYIFGGVFLGIFTVDQDVISIGTGFLRIFAPAYIVYVLINVFSATIRGCGEAVQPMIITVFGICGLRILWLVVALPLHHTMNMVALSYDVSWVATGIIFTIYYLRGHWFARCKARQSIAQHIE
ncbi:MAG: MATE family efflux transporter [Firmicutes bacterium]|nr:MATE family efflux transporter [Bacillota bacterium]